jgi:hypothetical protein
VQRQLLLALCPPGALLYCPLEQLLALLPQLLQGVLLPAKPA